MVGVWFPGSRTSCMRPWSPRSDHVAQGSPGSVPADESSWHSMRTPLVPASLPSTSHHEASGVGKGGLGRGLAHAVHHPQTWQPHDISTGLPCAVPSTMLSCSRCPSMPVPTLVTPDLLRLLCVRFSLLTRTWVDACFTLVVATRPPPYTRHVASTVADGWCLATPLPLPQASSPFHNPPIFPLPPLPHHDRWQRTPSTVLRSATHCRTVV
ncbi:hypothetical protein VTK73DRAFT_3803 [Phialemonium thermophilum]|uniref:Uncharacterized protein n=1 Tax=Phialemonium thermophilum TaxID=223376 RepID=A0ABR3VES4_9PEZI